MSGSADFLGQHVDRHVRGAADPLVRLSVDLYGTPARDLAQFRSYRQDLIVGASLQVSAPLGQYDPSRLLNLGTHRWSFHPEIGLSQAFGDWIAEAAGGATFFTTNDDFFGGHQRRQDPLYSGRANLVYNFRPGLWVSLDATFYAGGRTTLDGVDDNNRQSNSRVGTTFALPLNARMSLKFNASRGVSARTGNNFDLLGVGLQYRWGEGL